MKRYILLISSKGREYAVNTGKGEEKTNLLFYFLTFCHSFSLEEGVNIEQCSGTNVG